ncbi:hypothetical protein ES705_48199 [subsurface metagenome]
MKETTRKEGMMTSERQYRLFLKYTREYLSQITGYSKNYLSRIATGARAPSETFIGVCCHTLKEPQEYLFELVQPHEVSIDPALKGHPDQDLLETIDGLAARLTKAEEAVKALQDELRQYE